MVQRKAPQRLDTQAELKRCHVKLEKQPSFNHQQDTRRIRGADDLKKKMKMERSIIAADLKGVPKSTSPKNYMKPTSSSKERLQVTKNLNPSKPLKSLIRQSSLKAIRSLMMKRNLKGVVVNKATCSSTLKDSKFPKALELNQGGTEAEGISVMRVCPYTYCSLNGHFHEPLPPLKCFISARRQLIKTQKGMSSPFKVKGVGEEISEEFFVEIESGCSDECPNESYSDVSYKDSIDHNSELSDEYVEFDEQVEEVSGKVSAFGCGCEHGRIQKFCSVGAPCKLEVAEGAFLKNETECSECSDEDFGLATLFSDFSVERTISPNAEDEIEMSFSDKLSIEPIAPNVYANNQEAKEDSEYDGDDVQDSVFYDESEQQEKVSSPEGNIDKSKLGMRITRKKTTEDMEEMKEFNPRGPHFLSVEPDPDAEHVDLRHQTMDERKNSEEWMIDYALRRKLAPATKKKVAVLVEAFETVMPQQPDWKKPTSGFPHARIIQACN